MKKYYFLISSISIFIFVAFAPTTYAESSDLKTVVQGYFDALKKEEKKNIEVLLDSKTLEEKKAGQLTFGQIFFNDVEYSIESSSINGEKATVKVKALHPLVSFLANSVISGKDIAVFYERPKSSAASEAGQGKDIRVGSKSASIQKKGVLKKRIERDFELSLFSEAGSWKISFENIRGDLQGNLDSILAMGVRRPEFDDRKFEVTLLDGRTYLIDRQQYEALSRAWLLKIDKQEAVHYAEKQVRDEILKEKREAAKKNTRIEYVVHEGPAGDVRAWKKLRNRMSEDAVRQILGEPKEVSSEKVNGQRHTIWKYPKGRVHFYKKKTAKWKAPLARRVRINTNMKMKEFSESEIQTRIKAYIDAYKPHEPESLDDRIRDEILETKETMKMVSKYIRIPSGGQK